MNVAKHYENQRAPKPAVRRVIKRVEPKPKAKVYTLRNLFVLGGLMTFAILFGQLWMDSQITALHVETENIRRSIDYQNLVHTQLRSEILDLSSYSRVMEIATAHGLEVQENNIIFAD